MLPKNAKSILETRALGEAGSRDELAERQAGVLTIREGGPASSRIGGYGGESDVQYSYTLFCSCRRHSICRQSYEIHGPLS